VYFGSACTLNPRVVGFSYRLNPRGAERRSIMTQLRKYNRILGYGFHVMAFKCGRFIENLDPSDHIFKPLKTWTAHA